MDGSEAGVDFVLIQTFPLYYVNQAILMKLVFFKDNFYNKNKLGYTNHLPPHIQL